MAVPRAGAEASPLVSSQLSRVSVAAVRVGVALMWLQAAGWKVPPRFGDESTPTGLRRWTEFAVTHEVFPPYAWLVDTVVLPNFVVFGWAVLVVEMSLGAFLLIGLTTRFWAVIGLAQTVAIALSALNAPNEWPWAYVLMLLAHLALLATAAGRYAGLDAVLRPDWQRSDRPVARVLERVS